jgi:hypothetical protein
VAYGRQARSRFRHDGANVAGAFKLGLPPFLAFNAVGAAIWSSLAVGTGAIFHVQVNRVLEWAAEKGGWAALAIGIVVGLYIAFKWIQRWFFIRLFRSARITPGELHALMQLPLPPVILDARSAARRKLDPRRIPGALIVDTNAPVLHADVALDRDVVIYCT